MTQEPCKLSTNHERVFRGLERIKKESTALPQGLRTSKIGINYKGIESDKEKIY